MATRPRAAEATVERRRPSRADRRGQAPESAKAWPERAGVEPETNGSTAHDNVGPWSSMTPPPPDVRSSEGYGLPLRRQKALPEAPPEEPYERESDHFGPIVGASPIMHRLFDLIERVAPTDATVLILGESGTGKELVAEAIHRRSRRARRPMISINCGAIPANLVESELFGHERGSFTGADRVHRGHFECADGGTLFLDEICEMSRELQVKLLRVLESGTFQRVGGDRPLRSDVRLLAAAKPDLDVAVAEGRFREDLYYRLNVFPIRLPPLRERMGDLELIAGHFIARLNDSEHSGKVLAPAAMARLCAHDWPGNVRELKHALQRAYIFAENEIDASALVDLPRPRPKVALLESRDGIGFAGGAVPTLAQVERGAILATLEAVHGNKTVAAELLQISLKTLYTRLREYRAQAQAAGL